ncbi:hypothetical protein LAZ67_3005153 [Cordylochernes scorpioides]|uniref:RNA-directed DNA polymerase n=1 Tax=Cordylochernes scorpioides TaxID=51811 RepID=A0ABY6KDG0_9ARAC|nr:hypothetical protein LAZ67_3005153 [Cordylochernes scorpioides]
MSNFRLPRKFDCQVGETLRVSREPPLPPTRKPSLTMDSLDRALGVKDGGPGQALGFMYSEARCSKVQMEDLDKLWASCTPRPAAVRWRMYICLEHALGKLTPYNPLCPEYSPRRISNESVKGSCDLRVDKMVETRSGKMQDPAQERIKAEESAKPHPGATIGRDASSDPVVLNPNIDIPKYDGTEDPRPWIESLEEIGFLYHWADYIISRYAAMNMTGSAKTWLNLHKASFTSWENIKIRLIQDFSLDANKEELRMKLNRMQHWNEPAIRFAEDILVLCNKVDPAMEEETKIEHVIGGLKKEYSFALYLNPPKTTDDLLVVCKKMDYFEKKYRERVEKSRNLYNGPRYSRPQQQSRYVPPTAARNYQTTSRPQAPVSNNYKNDSPPTPRQYRNNFPQPSTPRRPYNPNFVPKPNLQRNTYNKSQEVSKNRTEDGRPICFKCNKPGHVARYCRVKFIRILEEDPTDTQEKVEEKGQMNEISEKLGPRLYADIGTFEALVDTGADLSVVDLRTALDTGHGISKLAKICAGPDGKKLDMVGSIFLNIKIDDETLSHNFVILKTHLRTLILGRDFLKKMNAKIDCKQETIKYDLTNNHDEINFEMLKIKSAKDSIVPECSMKLIKALVETEDGEYIIEESSKMFQTNGLRLARSLINVINRETHIWITNPYPRPLKIMKNQTLAFGSSPAKINVSREREVEKNEEPRFQINENLSPKEQKELKQVLERYGDLFSSRLGRTNLAKHRIDTEDAKPIKHKPYRVSAKERDIIKEQIDEMLTEGIIRPSSSPWSFPVILVKKRDGKYRFCVDYRKLNNVTVKDVYPIPRIDEVMDTLQGSTHFSAIDLRSGYWQVEVEERDKEKTAFTTAHGLYEFNVMPFGLCNAPATFERNMENMLGNLRWQICLCYLDDVIIYSPDFPTHLKRLEAVFRCFRESNLRLNDKKCRFAFEELEILGYITSKHGIKPAEHNIKAVRNFPRPKKVKEVQSFLGMCSYYRKFIKDFSKIADPLTNLIKKSVPFTWTERQEEAFQTLKTALLSPPILGHFNPNAPTYVHTDASNIGIGATLVQDIGGEEKVISYLSRTLSKAEQNYSTTEKECLAVVWSMSKLRPYLYGRHFKIVTDHHALCWLKNLKDPTGRLARWALKIQEYDFDIIHKSGKKHLDADGLSRGPLPETDWDEDFERLFLNQITDEEDKFIETRMSLDVTGVFFTRHQLSAWKSGVINCLGFWAKRWSDSHALKQFSNAEVSDTAYHVQQLTPPATATVLRNMKETKASHLHSLQLRGNQNSISTDDSAVAKTLRTAWSGGVTMGFKAGWSYLAASPTYGSVLGALNIWSVWSCYGFVSSDSSLVDGSQDLVAYQNQASCILNRHSRIHTDNKPFKCDLCDYRTSIKSYLVSHSSKHNDDKSFKCDYCDYSCSRKWDLKFHRYIHTGEKNLECEHCEYKTPRKSSLKLHMYIHTGNKPFKCEHCDYETTRKHCLNQHLRTHTGDELFKCDECDYKTARKFNLTRHLVKHTDKDSEEDKRAFKCKYCKYRATQKQQLLDHMSRHTGDKPHKCELCDYRTIRKYDLKLHMCTH